MLGRISPERFRRFAIATLFFLAAITVTGGAVRLTGSGLGCSDWPNCEENSLVGELDYHGAIEFGNRLITGLVSLSAIGTAVLSFRRAPRRRDLIKISLGIIGGIIGQIVVGGIVVLSEVNPWIVLLHFLLSMILIWLGVLLVYRAGIDDEVIAKGMRFEYRPQAWLISTLTAMVLVVGSLVSHSGPHTGSSEDLVIPRLPFDISQIVRVHGALVWVLLIVVLLHARWLARNNASSAEQRRLWLVVGLLVAQGAIGYTQYFNGVPPLLVGIHIAGAVSIWMAVLWYQLNSRAEPIDQPSRVSLTKAAFVQP